MLAAARTSASSVHEIKTLVLSALPSELLRKGRFDEISFVDQPAPGERAGILWIHLRLRRQDPEAFDLERLVEASDGFSGAEIEQAVIGSLQRREPLDTDASADELGSTVSLSVSRAEDIRRPRENARGRFVPVR